MLLALPAGVRWLELDAAPCAGALLPALARFAGLEELTLNGDASGVLWDVGPAAALGPLTSARLDFRRPSYLSSYTAFSDGSSCVYCTPHLLLVPPSVPRALRAAGALTSLELRVGWSEEAAQLCQAPPALQDLRCGWRAAACLQR